MPPINPLFLVAGGLLLFGALRGRGGQTGGQSPFLSSLFGGGGATSFGTTGTNPESLGSLLAGSADEDIGIEPIPALNFSAPAENILVGGVNTPVLAQQPRASRVPVTLGGGFAEGFELLGPGAGGLMSGTPILVAGGSIASPEAFSTNPAALTRLLNEVTNQRPAFNAGNVFSIESALGAEQSIGGDTTALAASFMRSGDFLRQPEAVDLDIGI